jgi:hypothetical protein
MTSKATAEFWACFRRLAAGVQEQARKKYRLWQQDPFHPSLHFKEVVPGLWSARINMQYRTLARRRGDLVVWFWIGTHADYDQLVSGR